MGENAEQVIVWLPGCQHSDDRTLSWSLFYELCLLFVRHVISSLTQTPEQIIKTGKLTTMSGYSWALLPPEIRLMILEELLHQGRHGTCAAVCSEWKAFFEPLNFYRLELQVPCLEQLGHVTTRTASLVRQIRLNIELPRYSCLSCHSYESGSRISRHGSIFSAAIQKLFTVLSAWKPTDRLALEINTFSPTDSEHWFKALDAQPDGESEQQQEEASTRWHDPKHGWIDGRQLKSPSARAMSRLCIPVCKRPISSIPEVYAVTQLIIRRECRRQIVPSALKLLLRKLPRLQIMAYEPWRVCHEHWKIRWNKEFAHVIQDALSSHLKVLTIFEDLNSEFLSAVNRDLVFGQIVDSNMTAAAELVRALVLRSCDLKHLSISFMIDAQQFLNSLQSTDCCHKLQSLTLTASILKRESQGGEIASFLSNASSFPQSMKQLERLIFWNSKPGEACAVIYQRDRSTQRATLVRRGTWHFELNDKVVESWKNVDPDFFLRIEHDQLQAAVKETGDAIYHLGLSGEVIDPTSARQLRQEEFVRSLTKAY